MNSVLFFSVVIICHTLPVWDNGLISCLDVSCFYAYQSQFGCKFVFVDIYYSSEAEN